MAWFRAITLLAALTFGLALSELGLRAAGWSGLSDGSDAYEYDGVLGWRLKPDIDVVRASAEFQHRVRTGPHGFRGDPPSEASTRVVVLGDSFVEAFQVPLEASFVHRADDALGDDTQVLNLGVSGYSPDQEALLWQSWSAHHDAAEVVLFVYGANDVLGVLRASSQGYDKPVIDPVAAPGSELSPTGRPLQARGARSRSVIQRLALYALFARAATSPVLRPLWSSIGVDLQDRDRPTDLLSTPASEEVRQGAARVGELLEWLDHDVATQGGRLTVVYAPSRLEVDAARFDSWRGTQNLDRLQGERLILEQCAARALRCVSLRPALEDAIRRGTRCYYPRDSHWDAGGHAVVAEALVGWLRVR